ncbi:MAG: hypothetical protein HDQ96_10780 [Lachnospiraceae bacterium]|nr:hypothetical protein [Lachnospiraceae bacterium]
MDVQNIKIESVTAKNSAGYETEEYRKTSGKDLNAMAEKELQALKLWLFGENIRIQAEQKKLLEMQNRFLKERVLLQEEIKMLNQKVTASRQRLRQDEQFFEKKMEILKSGFSQLDADRKAFEREKEDFRIRKEEAERKSSPRFLPENVGLFFAGVKNQLALKKRYKDLLKIYHPDNLAGDKAMMQEISKEYEHLKKMM